MSDSDNDDDTMSTVLAAVPAGPLLVAYELRLMADAQHPYTDFNSTPAMIKNVWRAAADYLEHTQIGTRH